MKEMKMKNLGRIILFFALALPLCAQVKVSVDKDQLVRGERATFTLSIAGEGKVQVPPFDELCGYSIENRIQSRKDVFSNGKRLQEISLSYTFMPLKSCVIEPFAVTVNDKEQMTQAVAVTVSNISISKNEPFVVELETDKTSLYVGEPFEMRLLFKERQNTDKIAESISLSDSKNIWIKSEQKGRAASQDGYLTRGNTYAVAAQQSGKLSLGPVRWDVQVRSQAKDYWGTWMATAKTRSLFSNEREIEVKPLPEGISLVGGVEIEVDVDKTQISANEAVNVTIRIKGRANVEDIQPFELQVEDAQVFKEEPKIAHDFQEGKYAGIFEQKLAIVAQRDFTVPAFELRYMDTETDTLKTIRSEPIEISVHNAAPAVKEELKITRAEETTAPETEVQSGALTVLEGMFLLLGGFIAGLLAWMIPWKRLLNKKKKKQTVSAEESKAVLQLLMGHLHHSSEIEELVKKLGENLYEGKRHAIDKKRLKVIVKQLQQG
jgi:hypothetical protein